MPVVLLCQVMVHLLERLQQLLHKHAKLDLKHHRSPWHPANTCVIAYNKCDESLGHTLFQYKPSYVYKGAIRSRLLQVFPLHVVYI